MRRGYIKCPYCDKGVFEIAKNENVDIFVDGKNDIRVNATIVEDENNRRLEMIHIPMNFCFKCGRKLVK